MGIVRRQSALNLVWSYLGVALGYLNKVILFSEILTKGEFGLLELLLTFMTIGAEIALLGTPKIITRFFPRFRGHPQREGSMMFFIVVYVLSGFAILTCLLLVFKPILISSYQENSPLFAENFLYVIPITLGYVMYKVTANISGSLFRSVIPMMAFEVVQKILMTALIGAYFYEWFDFEKVVLLYVIIHFAPSLIIFSDIIRQNLKWTVDWSIFRSRPGRLMIQYGLFSSISDATGILVQRVDMLLLGLLIGEADTGTYAIAIYFSAVIAKPSRSMTGILGPLIATRLKENNMKEVSLLYRKTALQNVLIGGFLLVGMIVNLGPFFELLPKHADAKLPAAILGLTLVLNTFTGPHRMILINTKHFRVDLWANLSLLITATLIDLWLIPRYQLVGAAVGTLTVMILYNLGLMLYVRHKFSIFPIGWKNVGILVVLAGICLVGLAIPPLSHPLLTMLARSVSVTLLYAGFMLWAKPSPDLHELMLIALGKVKKIFWRS